MSSKAGVRSEWSDKDLKDVEKKLPDTCGEQPFFCSATKQILEQLTMDDFLINTPQCCYSALFCKKITSGSLLFRLYIEEGKEIDWNLIVNDINHNAENFKMSVYTFLHKKIDEGYIYLFEMKIGHQCDVIDDSSKFPENQDLLHYLKEHNAENTIDDYKCLWINKRKLFAFVFIFDTQLKIVKEKDLPKWLKLIDRLNVQIIVKSGKEWNVPYYNQLISKFEKIIIIYSGHGSSSDVGPYFMNRLSESIHWVHFKRDHNVMVGFDCCDPRKVKIVSGNKPVEGQNITEFVYLENLWGFTGFWYFQSATENFSTYDTGKGSHYSHALIESLTVNDGKWETSLKEVNNTFCKSRPKFFKENEWIEKE